MPAWWRDDDDLRRRGADAKVGAGDVCWSTRRFAPSALEQARGHAPLLKPCVVAAHRVAHLNLLEDCEQQLVRIVGTRVYEQAPEGGVSM